MFGLFKAAFELTDAVLTPVTKTVELSTEVIKVVTEPVSEIANDVIDEFKEFNNDN